MDAQNVANFDRLTGFGAPGAIFLEKLIHRVVRVFVLAIPLNVVSCFFEKRDHKHKRKRRHVRKQKADFQWRIKLGQGYEQEKRIVEELKLVVQNVGQETQQIVLLIALSIRHKPRRLCSAIQSDTSAFSRNYAAAVSPD